MKEDLELLPIGSVCHAVLYAVDDPEILIPVKAIIESVDLSTNVLMPMYELRLIWLYDNILFLRQNFCERRFRIGSNPSKSPKIPAESTKNQQALADFLSKSKVRFKLEHWFVKKKRIDMEQLFVKLQRFIINRNFRRLATAMNRKPYGDNGGEFYVENRSEFISRIRKGFIDRFDSDEKFQSYCESSLYGGP